MPTASSAILASVTALSNNFVPAMLPANIVFVTVPVSPSVITVPDLLGNIIALSEVGFSALKAVSKSSTDVPSKTKPLTALV